MIEQRILKHKKIIKNAKGIRRRFWVRDQLVHENGLTLQFCLSLYKVESILAITMLSFPWKHLRAACRWAQAACRWAQAACCLPSDRMAYDRSPSERRPLERRPSEQRLLERRPSEQRPSPSHRSLTSLTVNSYKTICIHKFIDVYPPRPMQVYLNISI